MRRVTQSRADTVQNPPIWPAQRRSRTEALPSRPAPILVSVQVFPGPRASGRFAGSSNSKSRCCFPIAHGRD